MISRSLSEMYWKTNEQEFLGYAPGTLLVARHVSGGGFAGLPQQLHLSLVSAIAKGPPPRSVKFPEPGPGLEYRLGGSLFSTYQYWDDPYKLCPEDRPEGWLP